MTGRLVLGLLIGFLCACSGSDAERVVVAAGTTTVDSGLIEQLIETYRETNADVDFLVVGVGTAEALSLGGSGGADLLITHQAELEEVFLGDHPDAVAVPVFSSRFLLVGPADQAPAEGSVVEAFAAIAAAETPFVGRRDGSGTDAKEREIWSRTDVDPQAEAWYVETGQGMGFTLQVADQRSAFTLAEEGAFKASAEVLSVVPVSVTDPDRLLENPYRGIVVDPAASDAAVGFLEWLMLPAGREALHAANLALFGEVVYSPPG